MVAAAGSAEAARSEGRGRAPSTAKFVAAVFRARGVICRPQQNRSLLKAGFERQVAAQAAQVDQAEGDATPRGKGRPLEREQQHGELCDVEQDYLRR